MATGSHVGSNAEIHRLKKAQPHDFFKHMVYSGDEKNMREVSGVKVHDERRPLYCLSCMLRDGAIEHNFQYLRNDFYVLLFRWIIYLRTKLIKRGMNTIFDVIAILLTRQML